ncbi:MAG: HupE/UreJ family protein [Bacteroidales bacterium]|jgi:hypothetical protein|nr:HupE/UreJ family protein [Bacteroidales bacterium]
MFGLYLKLGIAHIADLQGYDHILFIVMLCAAYTLSRWKRVLVLVTAFTAGHSITLALATLDVVRPPTAWTEFLIPVTIFLTALSNLRTGDAEKDGAVLKYAAALFFGLIHGLGFSTYLRSLLGASSSVGMPLLAFNIGVELGQIAIVLSILLLTAILNHLLRVKQRDWILVLSGAGAGISLMLIFERFPS